MKFLASVMLLAASFNAHADCPSTLPLKGMITIAACDPAGGKCVAADQALYKYMQAAPDDGPETLSVALHGSPWHLYDGDFHILGIDELTAMVRQQGSKIKQVVLVASWSGIAPDSHTKSLAQKLSSALGGMPVTGQDGFVWVARDGMITTTQQAFTGRVSGYYTVGQNDKVMASLVAGWMFGMDAALAKEPNGYGQMRLGAANDIFLLCPEGALQAYDAAAKLKNPVAAFNAAIMRLERGKPGDAAAALVLLKQSAALGDQKAKAKLTALARNAPAT